MNPAIANMRFTIPPVMLFHNVKESTEMVILTPANASTIHGRYLPIFIKKVRIVITPSICAVLGREFEDRESVSGIQICLYCNINNLTTKKYVLINFLGAVTLYSTTMLDGHPCVKNYLRSTDYMLLDKAFSLCNYKEAIHALNYTIIQLKTYANPLIEV
jgi:hypothetical protein